jgi:hypothetical protein
VTGRSPLPRLTTSKPWRSLLRQGLFAGTTIGDAMSGGYFINLALTFVGISTVEPVVAVDNPAGPRHA